MKGEYLFHPDAEERWHGFLGHMNPGPRGRREERKGGDRGMGQGEWEKGDGGGEKRVGEPE